METKILRARNKAQQLRKDIMLGTMAGTTRQGGQRKQWLDTNNIETVKVCQFFFGISLPSVVLRSRTDKFEQKFSLRAEW